MGEVMWCQGCYQPAVSFEKLLDMGRQPLAEGGDGREYPLALMQCGNCGLVQLDYVPEQNAVFRPDHPYSTGNTKALRDHYAALASSVVGNGFERRTVVDIGANDGTFLNFLPDDYKRIAVEPTDQIDKSANGSVIAYKEFFTPAVAARIHKAHGEADVITAMNVLAHVPDVHDFLDGVHGLLADDGEFITENHDFHSISEGGQYDTIYHEHLRYYTLGTLTGLLEDHGFRVVSSQSIDTHGGSFRVTAKKTLGIFPGNIQRAKDALHHTLALLCGEGAMVYGVGATTRATPLIHYADIAEFIDYVCEVPESDKIGTLIPGTEIEVMDEAVLIRNQPDYALLLSYHLAKIIVPKLVEKGYRGKFIIPVPEVRIVDGWV